MQWERSNIWKEDLTLTLVCGRYNIDYTDMKWSQNLSRYSMLKQMDGNAIGLI